MNQRPELNIITVIVVEDEATIRMLAKMAFDDAGFEVIEASNAHQAIDILLTEAPRVHVLFTDIHMPGTIDGVDLANHARKNWPWVGLLIASGRAQPAKSELPDGSRFIPKPYDINAVVTHVRELAEAA